jgi:hypothetical protein
VVGVSGKVRKSRIRWPCRCANHHRDRHLQHRKR